MLNYYDNAGSPKLEGELYRYCRDESLDYFYTAEKAGKRRHNHEALVFFKELIKKHHRHVENSDQCCAHYLHEPKGLEL